jgi:2-keto-4-pentenoate hydratase/2-oxohepta-3-ene-1,7-dioic acid hydratase in catechol pathway
MPSTTGPDPELPIGGRCRVLVVGRPVVAVVTPDGLLATTLTSALDRLGDTPEVLPTIGTPLAAEQVTFLPPVEPRTLLYAGRNYQDHLAERPRPRQDAPVFFAKLASSLVGHRQPIRVAPDQDVDYEGELAVVIGRAARRVTEGSALEFVAGYTIVNDVSDRAVQHVNHQITMGKGPDTFGPIGPALVPRDQIGDGGGLRLRTWVNDELRQDRDTSAMIHHVRACIVAATRTVTLQPGDVIATGTPAGVGAYRTPPAFLHPGDRVAVAIHGLGMLLNPVAADPPVAPAG